MLINDHGDSSPAAIRFFSTVLAAATVVLFLVPQASAQLKSPAAFFGYELGERFTPHYRVADYVEHVAAESDLVEIFKYGETNEHRPLYMLVVSDLPEGQAREDARVKNLALTGLGDGGVGKIDVSDDMRPIVWLSYNVHGNESVSTEAAMKVLFDLADPANAQTKKWLENTIVIIDPCINPDGRDRYVNWYNRVVGAFPNANPDDWTHDEPWPGGRTNHYLFDLNRDWSWATQKETRHRLAVYSKWMPQVHVDFHEQGVNSPYYFAPAAKPYHEDITDWQVEMQHIIGRNNADYFDANNWLYFTRESFDLFYPGYGDTWPTYNGAIGMTYEQGGSSSAGLGIETAEGDTLTLFDRIAHHHATSLSTIEATSSNAKKVLDEFANYFSTSISSPPGEYASYVVNASERPDATADLIDLLEIQGIRYGFAENASTVRGFVYNNNENGSFSVKPGDLVIPASQPKARLVKILFEPDAVLGDSMTYDITAWSQPYAFGTSAVATTTRVPMHGKRVSAASVSVKRDRPYAYVVEWKSVRDQQFVTALLKQGISVRMASRPFMLDDMSFDRGSVVITRTGNSKASLRLDDVIAETANKYGQPVYPVTTGFIEKGTDFGSNAFQFIDAPKIAVLGGSNVSSGALGEIWYYFDHVLEYPVTIIPAESFGSVELADYDVVVLPSGNYSSALGDRELEAVQAWVRTGGRLVAIDRAVGFLAGKKGFSIVRRTSDSDTTTVTPDDGSWADESRKRISGSISGGIFGVSIDPTHPVGYGMGSRYFTLKNSSTAYEPMKKSAGWNVGVVTSGVPVSGFAGYKTAGQIKNSAAIAVQRSGRGSIVYLVDNPLYRGFWRAGNQLFGNAVLAN